MGTRAQFFIGNPQDLAKREYLGCVAWDGYTDGDCGRTLRGAKTAKQFRDRVAIIAEHRTDFGDQKTRSFPFPWTDDLFLTDVTYAFFGGEVKATIYHHGWRPLEAFFKAKHHDPYPDGAEDELPGDVPAPLSDLPPAPDSIMIISTRT